MGELMVNPGAIKKNTQDIGTLSNLTTTEKGSLVGAVNELNASIANLAKTITITGTTDSSGGLSLSSDYPPSQYNCFVTSSRAYNGEAYYAFVFINLAENVFNVDVRKRDLTALASNNVKLYATFVKK